MTKHNMYDLVIVGMGAAGLAAAASCHDASGGRARIAVIERAPSDQRGGATRWTNAALRLNDDGEFDPDWKHLVSQQSNGLADATYCEIMEANVMEALDYVKGFGVEIEKLPLFALGFHESGGGTHAMWQPVGGGASIVHHVGDAVDAHKHTDVFYETEAVSLHLEDGLVAGVNVRGADGRIRPLLGKAVLLACGGFEGNPEMLTQYLGERAVDLVPIAPGILNNTGDGIRMAMNIGAGTSGQFDMIHAEGVDPRSRKADAVVWSYLFGIVVNAQGERFFDEGASTLDRTFERLGWEIWRNQNQKAFLIGDRKYMANPYSAALNVTDIAPVVADTIEQLANQLGIDAEGLGRTVAAFNAAVPGTRIDPSRPDGAATTGINPPKSNWAESVSEGPFYGFPLTGAVTFTFGGLKTDSDGRVLTPTGRAIPGLYAAGEITGLFYHEYACATSVLRSITFGRRVGLRIGAELPVPVTQ
ncbi:FAD-binding protein [Ottowia thiooxydans]|uniref:Tricarballylate dehydrogenase n=1 Tax=Ottowia thiooxydans TaxID=219182 RepID=A0ABV2Q2T4_9BURK